MTLWATPPHDVGIPRGFPVMSVAASLNWQPHTSQQKQVIKTRPSQYTTQHKDIRIRMANLLPFMLGIVNVESFTSLASGSNGTSVSTLESATSKPRIAEQGIKTKQATYPTTMERSTMKAILRPFGPGNVGIKYPAIANLCNVCLFQLQPSPVRLVCHRLAVPRRLSLQLPLLIPLLFAPRSRR